VNLLRIDRFPTGVHIAGTGIYLPDRVVNNAALIALGAPLDEEEILKLSGIRTRRRAASEESTSHLAANAARSAITAAGLDLSDIDRLLLATNSPDTLVPSTACAVHGLLGLGDTSAVDLNAACAGFVYGLDLGARAVLTGDRAVLVVASELRSRFLNPTDRATCALFGDGAAAAVLTPGKSGSGLLAVLVAADGRGVDSVRVPAGGAKEPASPETVAARRHTIHMADGPHVYLSAVEGMLDTGRALLADLGLRFDDIDLLVPHQANERLIDRLARFAKVPEDRVYKNVDRYGNMSSASCAVALHEAIAEHDPPPGTRILLLTAGAGYTAGAALYQT
jgi:3-oxoacyl-[acyl-carrier-protein] synthase-3